VPPFDQVALETVQKFKNTTNAAPVNSGNDKIEAETDDYFDVGVRQRIIEGLNAGVDGFYKFGHDQLDLAQLAVAPPLFDDVGEQLLIPVTQGERLLDDGVDVLAHPVHLDRLDGNSLVGVAGHHQPGVVMHHPPEPVGAGQVLPRGDRRDTIDELLAVRGRLHEFGGSHAQRDVLERTLLEAAIRGGHLDVARALVSERISVRDSSTYAWSKRAELLARLGDREGLLQASVRADLLAARVRAASAAPA